MIFSGALHLSQQYSLYLSHQSNLLQQSFCPFLISASKQKYPSLSTVFQNDWNIKNKLRKTGGLSQCHEIQHCCSKYRNNYLEMLSKTTQAVRLHRQMGRVTEVMQCNKYPFYKNSPLDFSVLIPDLRCLQNSWNTCQCITRKGVCVNTIYAIFKNNCHKNAAALISCKMPQFCAALFWAAVLYCIGQIICIA